ncbi:MAG: lycopene cyclase family protein [Alphaproteobacteria bacterium]
MNKRYFDVIIIGAGVSGLILAYEISKRTNKSIAILEKEKKNNSSKNLCFWNTPHNILTKEADNKWKRISVVIDGKKKTLEDKKINYLRIKSTKLRNFFLKKLKKKGVKIFNEKVLSIDFESSEQISVISHMFHYNSSLLFDSRMKGFIDKKNKLFQHFYGVEVNFKKKVMNVDEVILMDIQKKKNTFNFMYILPYTNRRALIETTYFSKKLHSKNTYMKDIKKYLSVEFSGLEYNIKFSESGVIPMFKFDKLNFKNYSKIGTPGNWVKQSTGYSLQNSFIYSKQLVDCILEEKTLQTNVSFLTEFLDRVYCNFLKNNPDDSKQFFEKFFLRNNLRTIAKFLTNSANNWEIFKIILSLPKIKLMKSLIKDR